MWESASLSNSKPLVQTTVKKNPTTATKKTHTTIKVRIEITFEELEL
jgi:hypothetical protein